MIVVWGNLYRFVPLLLGVFLAAPIASSGAVREQAFPVKGTLSTAESKTLYFRGGARHYLIRPVGAEGPYPVVIFLHGGDSDARTAWTQTSLPTLAAVDKFIFVAPDASSNKHWNDGRGTVGQGKPSDADDVGFLKALITEIVARERGDPDAVFIAGFSNGGVMAIRFACEAGTLLRAGAIIAAEMPAEMQAGCKPGKPLPWLSMNGDRDDRLPFGGLRAGTFVLGRPQAGLLSADATFEFFADNARCGRPARVYKVPDVDSSDGSTAVRRVRKGCVWGAASTQYVFHGAGHSIPGYAYPAAEARSRHGVNEDVDAGSLIWEHFRQTLVSDVH